MATDPNVLEQRRLLIKADTLTHQAREDFMSFGEADNFVKQNVRVAIHTLNQFLKSVESA